MPNNQTSEAEHDFYAKKHQCKNDFITPKNQKSEAKHVFTTKNETERNLKKQLLQKIKIRS